VLPQQQQEEEKQQDKGSVPHQKM